MRDIGSKPTRGSCLQEWKSEGAGEIAGSAPWKNAGSILPGPVSLLKLPPKSTAAWGPNQQAMSSHLLTVLEAANLTSG